MSRLYKGSDRQLTCSVADFLIGDMCRESDVQDISQASLVEGIKTSCGRYSQSAWSLIAQFAITINSNVCPHIRVLNTLMRESYA